MKVGEVIKDGEGNEWVVGRLWKHEKWTDYALINKETRAEGSLRIKDNT